MISIREKLKQGRVSIGSWMHLPSSEVAEMMGDAGFDWVAVDMEHGCIAHHQLPDLFRALQLGNTVPLCRIATPEADLAIQALEAGAKGIIAPNISDRYQYLDIKHRINYPPTGLRGVGFNRANGYGKYFEDYLNFQPLLVPMIENVDAIGELKYICEEKPDAVFIGPYDLSASLGIAGQFDNDHYKHAVQTISGITMKYDVPLGIHTVQPDRKLLDEKRDAGFKFISYSADVVMLQHQLQSWNVL